MKIGDAALTDLTAEQVSDATKFHFPVVDFTTGAPGTDLDGTLAAVVGVANTRVIPAAAHGLDSGDVGSALCGSMLFDDADYSHSFSHVLLGVFDANTLRVAGPGADIQLAVALLEDGNTYDIAATGRFLFWDLSQSKYISELPADSAGSARSVLEVFNVGSTLFLARVL